MKIKVKKIVEVDITSMKAYLIQDWWDGAEIAFNNSDNYVEVEEDGSNLPMLVPVTDEITTNKYLQKYKAFILDIDLSNGKVKNWQQGISMKIYWKIVDQGIYEYYDENNQLFFSYEGYVPDELAIEDDGYGDYVILNINKDGFIENWNSDGDLGYQIQKTIENESNDN